MIIFAQLLQGLMNARDVHDMLKELKSGNREAFNQLFRAYYAPMVRYCVRFVPDIDVAAEIVQDLFVKLWSNHGSLNINTGFVPYMMQSVRNAAITYINRNRLHAEVNMSVYGEEGLAIDPSEELQGNNLEAAYLGVLQEMPEKRREVFVLSRFDGLKYGEIAERMGISVKTVEGHMSAAIKQLKTGLKDYI